PAPQVRRAPPAPPLPAVSHSPPVAAEPPRKHHAAPALVALDRVDSDGAFRIRPAGEIDRLAQNIARLGQLFPVELRLKPPDRYQVICGFRRVEALRFLQRDRVLARLHLDLSDEDALLMALAAAVDQAPISAEELAQARERLESEGRLTPAALDMLEKAAGGGELAPEEVEEAAAEEGEEEVDADELARDAALRMAELNQDLALLADVFASLEPERRRELLQQLAYTADLVAYLEQK
ncbi:MAG TPA: ParB/Srx family N-terminal domain-containing protein, partial [Myxococcales bacterium]|nr:ParB/Srx family N-terminal domain-containing protein [Myxococcales bacterium]